MHRTTHRIKKQIHITYLYNTNGANHNQPRIKRLIERRKV
nr:MAG TPA: hypothetical protein [Caudoviricetes sp.]